MNWSVIVFSWIWDRVLGDPRVSWHPVCLVGNLISYFEKKWLGSADSAETKRRKGFYLLISVLTITTLIAGGLQWLLLAALDYAGLPPLIGWVLLGLGISMTLSIRSLGEAGREIEKLLQDNHLEEARIKVSWIVGRDTEQMDESDMTRATVETIAENITDGIIAPLFYGAIGGLAFAWFYRATNTLDSMVGYKNEKYMDFGRYSALWDDVMNYIPARITGVLLILVALFSLNHPFRAIKMWFRDAEKHPSPNSGIPESIVAGILEVQLGGQNFYGGVPSFRTQMGDPIEKLSHYHISEVIFLLEGVSFLGIVLFSFVGAMIY